MANEFGLSVSRATIESHSGRIWANNNPSGGAAFHFTVPVAQIKSLGQQAKAFRELR